MDVKNLSDSVEIWPWVGGVDPRMQSKCIACIFACSPLRNLTQHNFICCLLHEIHDETQNARFFFLWRVSDLHLFLLLLVDTLLLCHLHRLSLFFLCYIFFTCFNVNFLLSQDFATPLSIVCYMTIIIVQESLTANNLLWLNVSSKCIGYWPCCVACLQNFFL